MSSEAPTPSGVVTHAPWRWMQANHLPKGIPDDAVLTVDQVGGVIHVEAYAVDEAGRRMTHAGEVMTIMAEYPLLVPPPPGLLEAYQHTVARLRRERSAAEAIRWETVDAVARRLTAEAAEALSGRGDADVPASGGLRRAWAAALAKAAEVYVWEAAGLHPQRTPPPDPMREGGG